jgi:hypothetical protein
MEARPGALTLSFDRRINPLPIRFRGPVELLEDFYREVEQILKERDAL